MLVRFLQDYQGAYTGPHFYRCGQAVDLPEHIACPLLVAGRVVEVKPKRVVRKRKSSSKQAVSKGE